MVKTPPPPAPDNNPYPGGGGDMFTSLVLLPALSPSFSPNHSLTHSLAVVIIAYLFTTRIYSSIFTLRRRRTLRLARFAVNHSRAHFGFDTLPIRLLPRHFHRRCDVPRFTCTFCPAQVHPGPPSPSRASVRLRLVILRRYSGIQAGPSGRLW